MLSVGEAPPEQQLFWVEGWERTRANTPEGRSGVEALGLEGCVVTIDVMGCQTSIAGGSSGGEADYVLRAKENQEGLRTDVEQPFDRSRERGFEADFTDVDGGHGRVETRRCWAMGVGGQRQRPVARGQLSCFDRNRAVRGGAKR